MGLFGSKKTAHCCLCKKEIVNGTRWSIADGLLCDDCKISLKPLGFFSSLDLKKINTNDLESLRKELEIWDASTIYTGWGGEIIIDNNNHVTLKLKFPTASYELENIQNVSFQEPEGLTNGFLHIVADDNTYTISFTRGERQDFVQAYFHILYYTPGGDKLNDELLNFEETKVVAGILHIDEAQEKWYIGETTLQCDSVYNYSDIKEVYSLKGDKVMTSASSGMMNGAIGRGIVGGVIGGATGAIIGSLTAPTQTSTSAIESQTMYIKIFVTAKPEPITITCPNEMVADNVLRSVSSMIKDLVTETNKLESDDNTSNVEEIRKYKSLLDDGIITDRKSVV